MSPGTPETAVDTVVIGAGISGLAYAHARGPDADLVVLEADSRAGGLVRTEVVDHIDSGTSVHYECGPEALQDNEPELLALLDEVGLAPRPAGPEAAQRFILREGPPGAASVDRADMDALEAAANPVFEDRGTPAGRLVALPANPKDFLTSELLSKAGKLRALSEPLRGRRKGLDGSVADFIRHRLGQEVLDWLVDPFVTGIYAGDTERISLQGAFPMLHAMVSEHGSLMKGMQARAKSRRAAAERGEHPPAGVPNLISVDGGLGAIPDALAAGLGERLHLSTAVRSISREGAGDPGAGDAGRGAAGTGAAWRIVAEAPGADGGTSRTWTARRVVVATSVGAAAGLLADLPHDLAPLSQALGEMECESVVSVAHLWRRTDVAHPCDGFGYLVPSRLGMHHLGTLFSSTIAPSRAPDGAVLLRTLLGGAHHPELVQADPDALRRIVADEVGAVLGLSGEPLWSTVVAWPRVLPRYDLAHPARQDRIDAILERAPGLHLLGNHRRGISVNNLIAAGRTLARAHQTS